MYADEDTPEPGEPGQPEVPKGQLICPKCHRPVDQYDRNAQRHPITRKWAHKDCRTKPRRAT